MRIIKPSKRSRKDRLDSQADPTQEAHELASYEERELVALSDLAYSERGTTSRKIPKGGRKTRAKSRQGARPTESGASADTATYSPQKDSSPQKSLREEIYSDLFTKGVRLLAMREHSVKELTDKLNTKSANIKQGGLIGVDTDIVYAVIDELIENNYLSDERFAESYVRSRTNRGFGPVKIRSELKAKGVSSTLIEEYLRLGAAHWYDNAEAQYQKKYGDTPVSDYNTWSKRARFMQSRGFTMEHIQVSLPKVDFD